MADLHALDWWNPSRVDRMGVIIEGGEHHSDLSLGDHITIDGESWTVRGIEWPHREDRTSLLVQKGHH